MEDLLKHVIDEVNRAIQEYNNKKNIEYKYILSGEYMILNSLYNQIIISEINIDDELKQNINELLNKLEEID